MATQLGSVFIDFRAGVASFDKDLKGIQKSLNSTAKSMSSMGDSLTKALTLPIGGAVFALGKMADSYQKAQKVLQTTGGATGESLNKLKKDFEAVAAEVPNSMAESARAIAQVEIRTGKTGEAAQELAKQFLNLSNNTGTDLNENLKQGLQLFDGWGVAAEDQAKTLDMINRAAQAAGGSVTDFLSGLGSADAVLGPLGIDLQTASVWMANFERGGIDGETTIKALNKALVFLSSNGVKDLKGGLESIITEIENTKDKSKQLDLAKQIFGAKGGAAMVDAIEEGRFAFNQFTKDIISGSETINGQAEKNRTFVESFAILGNKLNLALAPLGDQMLKAVEKLSPAIEKLIVDISQAVEWFVRLSPATQAATAEFLIFAAAFGPMLSWVSKFISAGAGLVGWFRTFLKTLSSSKLFLAAWEGGLSTAAQALLAPFQLLLPLLTPFAVGIGALAIVSEDFRKVLVGLVTDWGTWSQAIKEQFPTTTSLLTKGFDAMAKASSDWWAKTKADLFEFIETIGKVVNFIARNSQALAFIPGFQGLQAGIQGLNQFNAEMAGIVDKAGKIKEKNDQNAAAAKAFIDSMGGAEKVKENISQWAGNLAQTAKNWLGVADATKEATKAGDEHTTKGKSGNVNINALLEDQKKALEAIEKATQDVTKATKDLVTSHQIDKLKEGISDQIKGDSGDKAYFEKIAKEKAGALISANSDALDQISNDYYQKILDAHKEVLDAAGPIERQKFQEQAKLQAAEQLDIYKNEIVQQELEIDRQKHTASVTFWQGLMEDAISGTRFNFEEQFKKAMTQIVAIFITRMLEANILAADSFGEAFDIALGSLKGAFGEFFKASGLGDILGLGSGGGNILGSLFGSGSGAYALSSSLDFGATEIADSSFELASSLDFGASAAVDSSEMILDSSISASGALTDASSSASIFSSSLAGTAIPLAAVAAGAYSLYDSYKRLTKAFGSNQSNESKGAAVGTAALDTMFPGAGTAVAKVLDAFGVGGNKLTPNEASLKAFEHSVEDALKQSLGKSLNFVLGNIEQFADPNWSNEFWEQFGDKGATQFDALGKAFEKMMGLEPGTGGQIGALLAQNLAGGTTEESLNNMKLFLDSMNISTQQLSESLLEMGKAGNISWHEFTQLNAAIKQIPEEGLAGIGDFTGALDEVLTSSGRGIQALEGLKNIAIEAGEAGITSMDGLKMALQEAGYDTDTLNNLFASFAANGIDSLDELKGASDEVLAGIISSLEDGGIEWDKFAQAADDMNGAVKNLADQIKNLASAFDKIPDKITIDVQTTGGADVTANAKGAILKFAGGGLVRGPTIFPANGTLGLMGEAGPEAIMPLTRVNGKLGVAAAPLSGGSGGGGVIINVDARGAAAGVEAGLTSRMMDALKDAAVRGAIDAISDHGRRRVY